MVIERPREEIDHIVADGVEIRKGSLIVVHWYEEGDFIARVDSVAHYPAFADYGPHTTVSYHDAARSSRRGSTPHIDTIRPYKGACPHCKGSGFAS